MQSLQVITTMTDILAIYGAGGHGKVVADLAEELGYQKVVFFDDEYAVKKKLEHWDVKGDFAALLADVSKYAGVIVAIGNNRVRLEKITLLINKGANVISLIHPTANVSRYVSLGIGSVVCSNASVNAFAKIGMGAIINTNASVDHDCVLGQGVHICPGASLAGNVIVGDFSWIGIGSSIIQQVSVGCDCFVAAGSVVVKDVLDSQKVKSNPAKPY